MYRLGGDVRFIPPKMGILVYTVIDGITLMGLGGTVGDPAGDNLVNEWVSTGTSGSETMKTGMNSARGLWFLGTRT